MRAYTGGGPDLIWYGAAGNRIKAAITGFGILDGYRGFLVRDDYGGYLTTTPGSPASSSASPICAGTSGTPTRPTCNPRPRPGGRSATRSARPPRSRGRPRRRPGEPGSHPPGRAAPQLRQTVARGISVNLSRPWHKGNHPGLVLARRLKRTAAQVWLFAARLDIPATSNGSENASLLNLYAAGRLKLDELITRRYALDDVSQAYADMRSGVNIRGVVDFIPAG
jgi:transposase